MEELKFYKVYAHIRKEPDENGIYKRYIGITGLKPEKRWGNNGSGYKTKNRKSKHNYFYNAIQKHGWNNFEHKILIHGLTKEQAERWEVKLIKYFKSNDKSFGYNSTEGGNANIPNEEARKKMSESRKGKVPWNKGKTGFIVRNKCSHNIMLSPWNKGIPMTQEHYEKCKHTMFKSGHSPWNKGKKNCFTKYTLRKMSESKKGKMIGKNNPSSIKIVRLFDKKIYMSITECAKDNNIHHKTVSRHCNNIVSSPNFMYYTDWILINNIDKI